MIPFKFYLIAKLFFQFIICKNHYLDRYLLSLYEACSKVDDQQTQLSTTFWQGFC